MDTSVKQWLYRQCEIQHATTPDDIAGMVNAWRYATSVAVTTDQYPIDTHTISTLGRFVDPVANPDGRFRTGPAVFMDGGRAAHASRIPTLTNELLDMFNRGVVNPGEFYRELMWIHPFKDGNGRVGALVYNVLNGTILNPIDPPDYK